MSLVSDARSLSVSRVSISLAQLENKVSVASQPVGPTAVGSILLGVARVTGLKSSRGPLRTSGRFCPHLRLKLDELPGNFVAVPLG